MSQVMVGSKAIQNSRISIKILLADDSEIVRRGIRQLLATQTGIEIVGASQRRRFARTGAKRILRRLASGQSRECERESEDRQGISDATHICRAV